jgi:hypothetical protein
MSGFQVLLAVVGTSAAVLGIALLVLYGFNNAVRQSAQ